MTEDNAIIGASTMWELIERRATASGDHPMLFDAAGPSESSPPPSSVAPQASLPAG